MGTFQQGAKVFSHDPETVLRQSEVGLNIPAKFLDGHISLSLECSIGEHMPLFLLVWSQETYRSFSCSGDNCTPMNAVGFFDKVSIHQSSMVEIVSHRRGRTEVESHAQCFGAVKYTRLKVNMMEIIWCLK